MPDESTPSNVPAITSGQNTIIPLNSSYLSSASYDQANLRLTIEFKSGHVEQFIMVYPQQFVDLCAHPSPGSYFHQAIKGKFGSITIKSGPKGNIAKEKKAPEMKPFEKKIKIKHKAPKGYAIKFPPIRFGGGKV
jgi:hypothetical protein